MSLHLFKKSRLLVSVCAIALAAASGCSKKPALVDAGQSPNGSAASGARSSFSGGPGSDASGSGASGSGAAAMSANGSNPAVSSEHGAQAVTGATQVANGVVTHPQAPSDTCFSVSYEHKKMRSHSDDEDCSRHKNLLTLKHPVKSMTGLCVRVNGSPVQYQTVKGKADQIILGPIAGPLAKINVRYCIGKTQCTEECRIPKDEFMDAIGGSEAGELQAKAGQWDPASDHKALNNELNNELAEVEQINAGASQGTYVFGEWLSNDEAPACSGGRAIANVDSKKPSNL